jgi:peroxin-1
MGIAGKEGSGKSHCTLHIASRLYLSQMCSVVYLGCKTLQSSPQTTLVSILQEIQRAFEEAKYRQPSVLILDDLDCLIPNVGSGDSDGDGSIQHQMTNPALVGQVKVIVDHLILLSRDCSIPADSSKMTTSQGVICLCTCKDKDTISSRLMEVMHSFVDVPSLDLDQRIEFLCRHLLGEAFSPNAVPHIISRLGRLTDGYRLRDLHLIVTRIRNSADLRDLHHSISKQTKDLSLDDMGTDIETILEDFIPLSQQSLNISHNESIVEWSSIGGLFRTKQSLHDIIIHPMKFRQVYDNAPTSLPTGLMLFGYPGCGKSFLVPSLAKRSHLNLITCRGPELLDRYIGASEAKVRQLFARTVAASPALLFFDDFDALAPQRGSDHTGVTDRVVNQLLTLLDGVERNTKAQVFVVVATSRPDKIDNALLRPGRLEKHVYVGYPESQSEWNSLFSSMLSTRSVDDEVRQLQQNEDLFSFFCKDLDHIKEFCAADLKAVLDTAHLMAVHDILATSKEETCEVKIGKQHISDAFSRTRPSLLAVDRARFVRYFEPFRSKYNVTKEIGSGWNNSSLMNGLNKGNDSSIKLKTSLR